MLIYVTLFYLYIIHFPNKFYYLMNIPTIAVIHGRKNKNNDNGVYAVEIRLTVNRVVVGSFADAQSLAEGVPFFR